jgi:phage terminase large subunit
MKVNETLYSSLKKPKPINVQQGGTSSGKTYGILQHLLEEGARNNNEIITVYAEDIPALKAGAYRDTQHILESEPDLRKWYPLEKGYWNKSDRIFKCKSGSIIEFNSYSSELDARQGKRDRSFGNEANAIPYGIFEQINLRTKKQSIIDFNPSARFWAHDKLFGLSEVEWNVTTFRDNAFIDEKTIAKILSYEPTPENIERGTANEYRWKVYGLGEVGRLEGLIFPDFIVDSYYPKEYKWRVFGMDFGFTNDPTTLVEIRYAHGNLYWKEHIYETGLTNPDICDKLERLGMDKRDLIIADSAEPKSITEIKRKGWNIKGAVKGKDSINQGVDAIKRYKSYIHSGSKNLIEEFSSYIWDKDKDGNPTNKPIDKFNHGIDAGRYGLSMKLLHSKKLQIFSV